MGKLAAVVSTIGLVATTAAVQAEDWACKFTADRTANVPTSGVTRVVLGAGPGDLKVRGEGGRTSVQADGRACASTQELLDGIKLEARRDGDTVYLKTVFPTESNAGRQSVSMDLTVAVPDSVALSLEDSSGDLDLRQVQSAVVADSSGEQNIREIVADLQVTDSSGDIHIRNVGGNLTLKDSSGDVDVDDIKGDVTVTVDSSGDLDIRRVTGGVHIVNDSSGEIVVSDVQKDVRVDVDSSGSIKVSNVAGNFTVETDSTGSIAHNGVLGKVQVPERR